MLTDLPVTLRFSAIADLVGWVKRSFIRGDHPSDSTKAEPNMHRSSAIADLVGWVKRSFVKGDLSNQTKAKPNTSHSDYSLACE